MSAANKTFIRAIALTARDAAMGSDRARIETLKSLLGKVCRREVGKIVGPDTAANVSLTDAQWAKIEQRLRLDLGSADAESDQNA